MCLYSAVVVLILELKSWYVTGLPIVTRSKPVIAWKSVIGRLKETRAFVLMYLLGGCQDLLPQFPLFIFEIFLTIIPTIQYGSNGSRNFHFSASGVTLCGIGK